MRRPLLLVLAAISFFLLGLIFAVPLGLFTLSVRLDQPEPLLKIALASAVVLSAVFSLVVVAVNIGAAMGREFGKLPALTGYSINLAGSIIGVLVCTLIAWLHLPPPAWLVILGLF